MLTMQKEEKIDQVEEESAFENFEEILDDYMYQRPRRGQILEGEINSIDADAIVLDVGLKRSAIVPSREVGDLDDELFENLSVGDVIPVQITRTPIDDQDLLASIDNALEHQSWQNAKQYMQEDQLLELEVIGTNRGGLLVTFEKLEGFVPNSQVPALRKIRDRAKVNQHKQKMKGSKLKVKVIEVNPDKGRLIFSALEANKELRQERLQSLEEGAVITGQVVNVVNFGAFVDLGGIDGLVHISELDWHTVKHPSEVLAVGDEIDVKIIDVDVERERIQLSRKALLPNPWQQVAEHYQPGSLVEVEITSVVDFGAFGKLPEGVQGLIHKSEMGYTAPGNPMSVLQPGTKVLVKILKVEPDRERISLSMRRVPLEKQLDWMLADIDVDDEEPEAEETELATAESEPETEESEPEAVALESETEEADDEETDDEKDVDVVAEEHNAEAEAENDTEAVAEEDNPETEVENEA